jgi:hypothetical protein
MPKKNVRFRNQLLRAIPLELAATDRTRQAIAALPALEDRRQTTEDFTAVYGEREFLEERGVDLDQSENARCREARDRVTPFVTLYRGQRPPVDAVEGILPLLRSLRIALSDSAVHKEQARVGWDTLAQACELLAPVADLPSEVVTFVRLAIVEALATDAGDFDSNFDEHLSWGSPAPHVPAATAAMYLFPEHPDAASTEAVRRAAASRFRPARAQVASLLLRLYKTEPNLMWELASQSALEESSPGVVQAFVARSLGRLFALDAEQSMKFLSAASERAREGGPTWQKVLSAAQSLFVWRYLCGEVAAEPAVSALLDGRNEGTDAIRSMLFDLRRFVREDDASSVVVRRSVALLETCADLFTDDLAKLEVTAQERQLTETEVARVRAVSTNLHELASELYFASSAYSRPDNPKSRPDSRDLRFLADIMPTLRRLITVGMPGVVHKLLELVEFFVDDRADELFPIVTGLIQAGARNQYQYEPMGAELAVGLIERYMVSYRDVVESSDQNRRALIHALDVFASWPKAVRLVYDFDELFR